MEPFSIQFNVQITVKLFLGEEKGISSVLPTLGEVLFAFSKQVFQVLINLFVDVLNRTIVSIICQGFIQALLTVAVFEIKIEFSEKGTHLQVNRGSWGCCEPPWWVLDRAP